MAYSSPVPTSQATNDETLSVKEASKSSRSSRQSAGGK